MGKILNSDKEQRDNRETLKGVLSSLRARESWRAAPQEFMSVALIPMFRHPLASLSRRRVEL